MLGLRHRFAGISERRLQEHVPSSRLEDVLVMEQVRMYAMDEDVEEGGLLLVEEGRGDRVVRCTERGLDLLDAIMPRVVRSTETETRDAK